MDLDNNQNDNAEDQNGRPSDDNNPRPAQQARTIETPYDVTLVGKRVTMTTAISLQDLLNENVELNFRMNRCHLLVQILRIITPKAGNNIANTRYQRGNFQQKITFIRILLCRHENELCYIMMTNESNKRIFHRDLVLRDNGVVSIGTFMRILSPHPVQRNMQGIPLICADAPAVVMCMPSYFPSYDIVNTIQGNESGVAVLNNADIDIVRTVTIQTTCTGKHCDRQRPIELINQGCGCWGTTGIGISNLALMHTVVVRCRNVEFVMRNFSSNKFNLNTFLDKQFPQNVPVTALEHTDASDALEDSIDLCVDFVNENGGFTVVVWYTRGEINDKSLIGLNTQNDEGQADAGKLNYHIVQILPTNRNFLMDGHEMKNQLNQLKFKVSEHL